MCEVAPSLTDTYDAKAKTVARDFVAKATDGALTYCTQYTTPRKSAAYAGFIQGAKWAAAQMANTPELALNIQRYFEKFLLTGDMEDE
ncbi:MAG TPA: hypothetical protein VIY48_05470 [Candidatus Paceibacterota bacterium]